VTMQEILELAVRDYLADHESLHAHELPRSARSGKHSTPRRAAS
jgi:hypothetical protein